MKNVFEKFELMEAYANYDETSDLIFWNEDGNRILFRNVQAPEDWDGETDWTEDEDYVSKAVEDLEIRIL